MPETNCSYQDICENEAQCHICVDMSYFSPILDKFTCFECNGENWCDFAYDIKNLNGKCVVIDAK